MSPEIALSTPLEALPEVPALAQAHSDAHLIEIWLHGRSVHTQRAYRADLVRFRRGTGKPLPSVTLTDLQAQEFFYAMKNGDWALALRPSVGAAQSSAGATTAKTLGR